MKDFHKLYASRKKKTLQALHFYHACTRHHKSKNFNAYLSDMAENETTHFCVKQAALKMNYIANVMLN